MPSAPSAVGGAPRQSGSGRPSTGSGVGGYKDKDEAERPRDERDRGEALAQNAINAPSVAGGQSTANAASSGGQSSHQVAASSTGGPPAEVPMNNYTFFVRYTYSNECALLAYNFHELVTRLGIFEQFTYKHDHRLISVTLAYIFYRYQVHHCDMALDLAVTLVYLEDCRPAEVPELQEHRDAFNLICYLAFLAHAFNADRTIRLSDWYKEIGWRSFRSCQQLNGYVFFLFSKVRRFRLRVSETRVKRYIQKLCSVPPHINSEAPAGGASSTSRQS